VVQYSAFAEIKMEKQSHEEAADSHKTHVFEEPSHPVQVAAKPHELHGFLLLSWEGMITK
jgi:hypothetical protein